MESHGSSNDLNDQQVLPTNQLRDNVAIEGERHLRGPQHTPQTTEELIVTSRVHRNLQAQDHVVVNMDLIILDPHSQDTYLSIQGPVAFQVGLSSIVDLILGPNRSNPIWRLRLLAAFTLVVATMVAVLYLPQNLHGVHATYWRFMLMTTIGSSIIVPAISLFVTFWFASDPHGRSQSITTGLSIANLSVLVSLVVVYWAVKHGNGN